MVVFSGLIKHNVPALDLRTYLPLEYLFLLHKRTSSLKSKVSVINLKKKTRTEKYEIYNP